jgi:hypothetical protein
LRSASLAGEMMLPTVTEPRPYGTCPAMGRADSLILRTDCLSCHVRIYPQNVRRLPSIAGHTHAPNALEI